MVWLPKMVEVGRLLVFFFWTKNTAYLKRVLCSVLTSGDVARRISPISAWDASDRLCRHQKAVAAVMDMQQTHLHKFSSIHLIRFWLP